MTISERTVTRAAKDCLCCIAATGVAVALVYAKTYGLEEVKRRMCEAHMRGLVE